MTQTLPGQHHSSMSTHRAHKDETLLLSKHASDSPQTSPTVQEGQGTPQQESKTGAKHMGEKKHILRSAFTALRASSRKFVGSSHTILYSASVAVIN